MSMSFLGIQIDAVYHTSIVIGGYEWYYGHGVQSSIPGKTHHGSPMEIVPLGTTSLPDEVVLEYIDSMRLEYTAESYDLFLHNCNNFTADLAMFLCGVGIPEKIKNLPQEVLNTPFGQMMRPALERQLRPITTGHPEPPRAAEASKVKTVVSVSQLEDIIDSAPCTVVFFTSATCPPCRVVYPHFEQLAADERGTFVKIDVGVQRDIGGKYQISATPTFITWSKGEKLDEWKGASPDELKQKVDLLMRVTYPPTAAHRHTNLSIPTTLNQAYSTSTHPVVFNKIPPLDKVVTKLGPTADDPNVQSLVQFLRHRAAEGAAYVRIPDESKWASFLQSSFFALPSDTLFPLVDLFRASLADPRVSGWFAEEKGCAVVSSIDRIMLTTVDNATITTMLRYATAEENVPYNIRLVTAQAVCNLFTSPLIASHLVSPPLLPLLITLITTFLLDCKHSHLRVAASSVAFLLAAHVQKERSTKNKEALPDEALVELAASFVEALKEETESVEVIKGLTLSLALVYYCVPEGSELPDTLVALEAEKVLKDKSRVKTIAVDKVLCTEVAALMRM
jgi:thiol-disulfide isomerase/thioredoxin